MKSTIIATILLSFTYLSIAQSFQEDWRYCFGHAGIDEANDMIKTNTGYYILTTINELDIRLIKTDNNGNFIWDKIYGGSECDYAMRLIPISNGQFYIVGEAFSSDGDITNDPYPYSRDYWIVKIDSCGNKIWDRIYGGSDRDEIQTGCYCINDGITVAGWSLSYDGDVPGNYGYHDMWIIALDSSGNEKWNTLIGTDGQDQPGVIKQTNDKGYIIGSTSLAMSQPAGNIPCVDPYKDCELVLNKLDSLGNILWNRCYGGSEKETMLDILELPDGYLGACLSSSSDGDLTNSGYHIGYNYPGSYTTDTWMVKFDFDGNILWQKCYGGSGNEYPTKMFKTEKGFRVFNVSKSLDGDVQGNHSWNDTYSDIWTFEIDSVGNLLSNQCFGSSSSEIAYDGFVKLSDAQYTFAGHTISYDWNCQEEYDVFLMKITDTLIDARHEDIIPGIISGYPNPAHDYINFQNAENLSVKLLISDIIGTQKKEYTLNPGNNTIRLNNFHPGIYIFQYDYNKVTITSKFIVY